MPQRRRARTTSRRIRIRKIRVAGFRGKEAVKRHPAVSDALVIGVPDERFGEAVVAVVGLRQGELADGEDITGALQDLARYKRPRSYVFVDAIKRGPNGKADYGWAKEAARLQLDTK